LPGFVNSKNFAKGNNTLYVTAYKYICNPQQVLGTINGIR